MLTSRVKKIFTEQDKNFLILFRADRIDEIRLLSCQVQTQTIQMRYMRIFFSISASQWATAF